MPLLALAIALLLAGPVYGGDCSGTAPNDLCETGRPALTASSLTLSGRSSDGSGTARRSKPSRSPKVHSAISAVASAIEVRRSTESTPPGLKTLSTKLVRVNEAGEIHVYVVLTEWRPEHVAALEALGRALDAAKRRHITINATGAVAAVLADAGVPPEILRGFALIARCAGLVAHVHEEQRTPAMHAIWAAADQAVPYCSPTGED